MQNDVTFFAAFLARMASCNQNTHVCSFHGLSVNGDTIQMLFVWGGCVQNQIYRVFTFFNKERSSSPCISCSLAHLPTLGGEGQGQHMSRERREEERIIEADEKHQVGGKNLLRPNGNL